MQYRPQVSRRTALKGVGVSLALPWLQSLAPRSLLAAEGAVAAPRRMACIFVPNGIHMQDWKPKADGFGFQLPYILEPLANVRDDLLVITGLTHDKGRDNGDGPGDHARSASVFLTGAQPRKTDGANIRSGVSVDQCAAQAIGHATRFPSIELGCEAGRSAGNCDSGYSCAYSSSISWGSEATPMGKEVNPRLVYERLVGSESGDARVRAERLALRKSVLDYVLDDARGLQSQLGQGDQRKLDEYLAGVREIERRLDRSDDETREADMGSGLHVPYVVPRDYAQHLRLMCDMIVLAFHSDSTRIATLMFADAGSNRNYRHIDVPDGHHDLSHHGGDAKKHAKIRQINRFHVTQLAYLLQKLKAIPEGDGSLLDNCMVLYGSGLSDGNRHNHDDLPVLVAGRAGGTIDTGRHVRVAPETPMCNLFISMLDRMGAPTYFIGDSTGSLPELQV
jgi:hypothetical protein